MSNLLTNILRFVGLILLQVLVLNNIRLGGYINPFVYILFVMMLPFSLPGWLLLLSGFGTGLVMDLFMSTPGLHAGAGVFMAFMRPYVIELATGSKEPENVNMPSLSQMGLRWWFSYTSTLVLMHHFALFFLESFSFSQFGGTLMRILFSVIFSQIIILLLSFFFLQKQKR
ncbi:MAG: hypothetical protein Q7V19_07585 [Bacteroidales bacterium]|jgi:hypothetical protein|nr:hypothetical protein [Bacteroidales bacterium]